MTGEKRAIGVKVISIAAILYGVLDMAQLFMPVISNDRIEYSIPITGLLFLISGVGTLIKKEWGRKGMIFACFVVIAQSVIGIIYDFPLNIIFHSISIVIPGLVICFFMRKSTELYFSKRSL
jgi:hypothetical protein